MPQGHKFGVNPFDISVHDTSTSYAEKDHLRAWQHHVMLHWLPGLTPTGNFDGETQRAVYEVQRVSGLHLTGFLDADTWEATYKRQTFVQGLPAELVESAPETALEAPQAPEEAPAEESDGAELVAIPEAVKRPPGRPRKGAPR